MEWSRGPTIGRGATATVSIASANSGDLFAVKSAELSRSSLLQREQQFLSRLSSPHVVQYMGFEINKPMYNLFIEYVAGGAISDEIKRQGGSIKESAIKSYARQILQGLNYLHSNGVVHCDIKCDNLLMGKDGVKIADLGCARWVEDATSAFSGTPAFMSPEVARGEKQGFEADVWAVGCTMIEMATGSHPWQDLTDPVSALYRIGFSGEVPDLPAWFSDEARDFLSKCLERDCNERWTAEQLLQHPFMELDSMKVDGFVENSPISVLDQGFWDSVEAEEGHRNPTHVGSPSNSPAERINALIGGNLWSDSSLPNWDWDEDWVTVRSKDFGGGVIFLEQNHSINPNETHLIETESYTVSDVDLEDFGNTIVVDEDLLPEIIIDTFSDFDCLCDSIDFVMHHESVEDVIFPTVVREIVNENFVLVQFKCSIDFSPCSTKLINTGIQTSLSTSSSDSLTSTAQPH